MKEKKAWYKNTTLLTFVAMVIGAVLGMVFGKSMSNFKFIGDIWLNCLKMILAPMVFCILTLAVGTQSNLKTLGRVALKIFIYYIATTMFAVLVGITTSSILKPGSGMSLEGYASTEVATGSAFSLPTFLSSLFSSGIVQTFADANMLQIITISIFAGVAILGMKNETRKESIIHALQCVNDWINVYIGYIIKLAPVGVLFLMADSFGKYGATLLTSMAGLIGTFWLGLLLQVLIVYCGVLFFTAGINPIRFLRDSSQVWTFTMATCSSVANIPNGIDCAEKKFKVPSYIANFGIPLGANINYDGAAILHGCVLIFISQMYGFTFTPGQLVQIVLVASLISSAGGGIPGSNLVKMMVVVETFGLPVEIIGIIAGFYRLFDMGTTTGNCLGDLAGTVAISEWEKKRAKKLGIELQEEELHM